MANQNQHFLQTCGLWEVNKTCYYLLFDFPYRYFTKITPKYFSFFYIPSLLFNFIIIIILLYNIVLVLPYINMHPPWVYTCSPSRTLLPPPSPYHPSGSSQCTSPKLPVSCIEPGLAIRFLYDIIHVLMPFKVVF